jgi:putative colanic acid biosynthesis UDP-glucose lipid carrier transferase
MTPSQAILRLRTDASHRRLSPPVLRALIRLGLQATDLTAIAAAGIFASAWQPSAAGPGATANILIACLLACHLFPALKAYGPISPGAPSLVLRLLAGWAAISMTMAILTLVMDAGDERHLAWLGAWLLSGALALALTRVAWGLTLGHGTGQQRLARKVAIVGGGELLAATAARLARNSRLGTNVVAVLELGLPAADELPAFRQRLFRVADLQARIASGDTVERVVLACPADQLDRAAEALRHLPIDVDWAAPALGSASCAAGERSLSLLPLQRRPISGTFAVLKAVEDRVLGGLLLLFVAPLMLLIALLIKLTSPGPVLYRQLRHGFDHELISVLKFRTMHVASCDAADAAAFRQATRHDPRITGIGGFLRRTSLDELPQLINVVRGEMSLVGPRPHPVALNERYLHRIEGYLGRHRVRPGITGWAQINGCRGETVDDEAMLRRLRYDLEYIENWSPIVDLKILMLTAFRGFINQNAY